jgi:hypothetical protein
LLDLVGLVVSHSSRVHWEPLQQSDGIFQLVMRHADGTTVKPLYKDGLGTPGVILIEEVSL